MTVSFLVRGIAQPKGSTRSFVVRRKSGQLGTATTSDNPKLKDWQHAVATEARLAAAGTFFDREVPVIVLVTFGLPRPASAPKRVTEPIRKPDIDKLLRAVLDGCTGVLWADDAQVVEATGRKIYADAGDGPYARVTVRAAA